MSETPLSPTLLRSRRRLALTACALAATLAPAPSALAGPATAAAAASPAATSPPTVTPAPVTADTAFASVSSAVRARVAAGYSPAVVAAVVSADRPQPQVIAVGRNNGRALTTNTTFEIGSITKTFTATLLAEMVGRGEVKLTDPVSALLPAGTVVPSLHGRQITLEDLATHRSGLPREATDLFPGGVIPATIQDAAKGYAAYSPERMLAFLKGYTLPRDPGAEFEYSNLGEGLLGYALAQRAGKPYEELLRERVLSPLGVPGIGFGSSPFATPHTADGDPTPVADLGAMAPAGSLRASAPDLASYARANLLALTGQTTGPLSEAMRLALAPRRDADEGKQIGLNWIHEGTGAEELYWHNGGTFGSSSFLAIDPTARVAVVVLSASLSSIDDIGVHALLPSIPLQTFPHERRVSRAALTDCIGTYDLGDGDVAEIKRSGQRLVATIPGSAPILLRPLGRDRFFSRIGLEVRFTRNARGVVNGLDVTEGGPKLHAKKLSPKRS